MEIKKDVIIALDFSTLEETLNFLDQFKNEKPFVKIGLELYLAEGQKVIEEIKKRGHKIFLDLKLHDIPNTVYKAVKVLLKLDIDMFTVHASGGEQMLTLAKQAIEESNKNTKILAVTQLTSISQEEMQKTQLIEKTLEESVINYAKLAYKCKLDGVISSVLETKKIKENTSGKFLSVTPAIRLENDIASDQKRIATPQKAKENGSDFIVVGRSITKSKNPCQTYKKIKEIFTSI